MSDTLHSPFAKQVVRALDHLQLALDLEHGVLHARDHHQPWKSLRRDADHAWDQVLLDLNKVAATKGLPRDDARLGVLCDRIARYLEGDDLDPTHWKAAMLGHQPSDANEKLLRRGIDLTCAYATLLDIQAFAA